MKLMMTLSLLLNLAVLIPVCAGLMTNAGWARAAYGWAVPARGILLSVYLSIAAGSMLLLASGNPGQAAFLLLMQILYKLTTPATVGTFRNPVVISNLLIAAFHAATLTVLWRATGNAFAGR
jgi:hypothetical protein